MNGCIGVCWRTHLDGLLDGLSAAQHLLDERVVSVLVALLSRLEHPRQAPELPPELTGDALLALEVFLQRDQRVLELALVGVVGSLQVAHARHHRLALCVDGFVEVATEGVQLLLAEFLGQAILFSEQR